MRSNLPRAEADTLFQPFIGRPSRLDERAAPLRPGCTLNVPATLFWRPSMRLQAIELAGVFALVLSSCAASDDQPPVATSTQQTTSTTSQQGPAATNTTSTTTT